MAKRRKFVFKTELTLSEAINNLNIKEQVKILPKGFNESGGYIAFSKKVPQEVLDKVYTALEILGDTGELDKIFGYYAGY